MGAIQGPAAYGGQMARYFRIGSADSLVIAPARKPPLAITRLISSVGLPEQTASIPPWHRLPAVLMFQMRRKPSRIKKIVSATKIHIAFHITEFNRFIVICL